MKNNKFIILFALACSFAFAQEKKGNASVSALSILLVKDSSSLNKYNDKWSLEIGTGVSIGTRPYTDGYGLLDKNSLFNGMNINCFTIGGTYNSSKFISYKVDFSFDQFKNGTVANSKPFETVQYRTSMQGQINMSRLANLKRDYSKFNLLFHGGIQIARLVPIPANYSNKNLSSGDNFAGVVFGITPTYEILQKVRLFVDISSFNNYGQNLTWNGLGSKVSNNAQGHMYAIVFGLSVGLDGKK